MQNCIDLCHLEAPIHFTTYLSFYKDRQYKMEAIYKWWTAILFMMRKEVILTIFIISSTYLVGLKPIYFDSFVDLFGFRLFCCIIVSIFSINTAVQGPYIHRNFTYWSVTLLLERGLYLFYLVWLSTNRVNHLQNTNPFSHDEWLLMTFLHLQ